MCEEHAGIYQCATQGEGRNSEALTSGSVIVKKKKSKREATIRPHRSINCSCVTAFQRQTEAQTTNCQFLQTDYFLFLLVEFFPSLIALFYLFHVPQTSLFLSFPDSS